MNIKKHSLVLFAAIMLLSACSGVRTGGIGATLVNDKAAILAELRALPEACSYKGRVAVQYTDYYEQETSFRAILDKRCDGYMKMTILGPFNVAMGELLVENGRYTVTKDGEDVTDMLWVGFGEAEVKLFMDSFRTPPELPDESYAMSSIDNTYIFKKAANTFTSSPDFNLYAIEKPQYTIGYTMEGGYPSSIMFSMGMMTLSVKFTDKWVLP